MTQIKNEAHQGGNKLEININGQKYAWSGQYITGLEIKKLAGLPEASELYLSLQDPWDDELVTNEAKVDLARPGVEQFLTKQKLELTIEHKPYQWSEQYITGAEIRRLGKIPDDCQIFLTIKGPHEDELIHDGDKVNLARPGIEHFYGCKPNTNNG